MDRDKLVVVTLVTMAMLFVISLGAGAGRDRGSTDRPPAIMKALRRLQVKNFVQVRAPVESTCSGTPDLLTVDRACEVTLPATGFFSKPRRIALEESSNPLPPKNRRGAEEEVPDVTVEFIPADGTDQQKKLSPSECIEIAVDRHGGRLHVTCDPRSCQLRLLNHACPRATRLGPRER